MPPPISVPPGYFIQQTEDSGGGGKHIRIVPPGVMDPQNSFVGSPSVPHSHQPPIPMQPVPPGYIHPNVSI